MFAKIFHATEQSPLTAEGCSPADVDLLRKFQVDSKPTPGFVTDFVGSKTDVRFGTHMTNLAGAVERKLPLPGSFHADAIEWVGVLRAVEDATNETFVMAEIGAGYGPWIASAWKALCKKVSNPKFRAVAVEADTQHCDWIRRHAEANQIAKENLKIIEAAATVDGRPVFFPIIDPAADWGAAASETAEKTDYRGFQLDHRPVAGISLTDALNSHERYDLVHVDIQGSELSVIPASLDCLNAKVQRLVIGTHSRKIEGDLLTSLSAVGWILENEKPCQFAFNGSGEPITERHVRIDGTQVWRNSRVV
ncbi:hypothetical protein [Hyphomicrobium sp.]|uniref:hypothetical protein n=1 Tax=Hyphomicrobium sp. TaxID=82 RepID=UPI000FAC01E3|nr:hypothetical protein [Hyphomicrobium sp.]RUO99216.1 MAG: hypothetical protein EKK30_08260 [Hyphomicrobium sp.]